MLAYQETLTEPWYYDGDGGCMGWSRGVAEVKEVYDFDEYFSSGKGSDYDMASLPADVFNLEDVTLERIWNCGICSDTYYDSDHQPMIQFQEGDKVWVCGECETWYTEESEAVACCKEE